MIFMRKVGLLAFSFLLFGLSFSLSYAKQTAGAIEIVTILPDNIKLEAKLDTGAKNSSLDAHNIEYFEKNDQEWVRFRVKRSLNRKDFTLEYPLNRNVRIISRSQAQEDEKPYYRRPVINMELCLNGMRKTVEVNLANRTNFTYPFLLGATALEEFNLLVDVQKDFLLDARCFSPNNKAKQESE